MKIRIIIFLFIITGLAACTEHKSSPFSFQEINPDKKIDDFEDRDFNGSISGTWNVEKDSSSGSISKMIIPGFSHSSGALKIEYVLNNWCNVNLNFGTLNLKGYEGLHIVIKGNGHPARVDICTTDITDSDWYGYTITKTDPYWTVYNIDFGRLSRKGFGKQQPYPDFELNKIFKIQIGSASEISGEVGWIAVDDIYFYKVE